MLNLQWAGAFSCDSVYFMCEAAFADVWVARLAVPATAFFLEVTT